MFSARSSGGDSLSAYGSGALAMPSSSGNLRVQSDWERQMDSADKQQSQLLHMQWGLVKDQMAGFQREMGAVRSDLNALQMNCQQGESGMREMRDGIDGLIQSIEAQVMQNLKQHRLQFEQTLEEQCRRMAEHMGTLENEVREQQRILHIGFDSEKNERERLHQHFTNRGNEQTSQWQTLQDEIAQAHGALHDRLSKHDEHRNGIQAALAQCDSDIRCELGRLQNDHAGLKDAMNGQKATLDSHASGHSVALRDLDDKIRMEMLRIQEDQRSGVRGASESHLKALEELERKVAAEQRALAEETKRGQGAMQNMISSNKDSHQEALQKHLANLDAELRKEIDRRSTQHGEMSDAMHAKLGTHQAGVDKFLDEHRRGVEEIKSETLRSKLDIQKAVDELQRHLQQAQGSHAGHTDAISELRMLIGEQKVESDRRFDGLKKETGKLAGEVDSRHSGMQDALNGHKNMLDKLIGSIRGDHDSFRDLMSANLKDIERSLRKDLSKLSDDHETDHSKLQDQFERAKSDHKTTSQAQLEELDASMRREIQRLQSEHKSAHSKICDMFDDHKTANERAFATERAAREDHKGGLQVSLSELEKQLLKELKRLGEDQKSEHNKLLEHVNNHKVGVDKQLVGHRSEAEQQRLALLAELADNRASTERHLAGQKSAFDTHQSSFQDSLADMEQKLRKELERHGESHAGHVGNLQRQMDEAKLEHQRHSQAGLQQLEAETRALIQKISDEHGRKNSSLQSMLESMDAQLHVELGGKEDLQKAIDCLAAEHKEKFHGMDQKHSGLHLQFQETLSEHKLVVEKLMGGQMDGLREMVQSEKTERFRHHASLQERFDVIETALGREDADMRERLKSQMEQSGMTRTEFEGEVQRIWQALDSHTHVEEAKTQVIEERIIMKQEPARPVAAMIAPQPRMLMQQSPRVTEVREEIIMGGRQVQMGVPLRTQSIGAMGMPTTVMPTGSIRQARTSSMGIQEIDIITTR